MASPPSRRRYSGTTPSHVGLSIGARAPEPRKLTSSLSAVEKSLDFLRGKQDQRTPNRRSTLPSRSVCGACFARISPVVFRARTRESRIFCASMRVEFLAQLSAQPDPPAVARSVSAQVRSSLQALTRTYSFRSRYRALPPARSGVLCPASPCCFRNAASPIVFFLPH